MPAVTTQPDDLNQSTTVVHYGDENVIGTIYDERGTIPTRGRYAAWSPKAGTRNGHVGFFATKTEAIAAITATHGITPEPEVNEEPEENVVSVLGGKVHTPMPGIPHDHPYPLCRGGGMNQMLTKFRRTKTPLTCTMCLRYQERREAARAKQ